jgi:hypothetical protein
MLVDAHTHIVSSDHEAYPLSPAALGGSWYLQSPCSAEGLIDEMDGAGVDRAILVLGDDLDPGVDRGEVSHVLLEAVVELGRVQHSDDQPVTHCRAPGLTCRARWSCRSGQQAQRLLDGSVRPVDDCGFVDSAQGVLDGHDPHVGQSQRGGHLGCEVTEGAGSH